jgi:hypothetical protein
MSIPALFESHNQTSFQLFGIDTDLTSNPSAWHNGILRCADCAFSLLVRVSWTEFELKMDDITFLFGVAARLLELFPSHANFMVVGLVEAGVFHNEDLAEFLTLFGSIRTE